MSLGSILSVAAPIAAGYFTGGTGTSLFGLEATGSAIAAGALTGAGIAALSGGDILTSAAMGGLGGYGGGELGAAFNPAGASGIAAATGTTNAAVNQAAMSNMTGSALGQGGFNTAAGRGLMGVASPGIAGAAGAGANTGLQNVTAGNTGQGFSPYATPDTLGESVTQFSTTGGYDPSAVSNIGSVQTPDYVNTALTSDPSKQMLTNNALPTYTDGIEDTLIRRPDFSPIAGSNVAEGAIPGGYVDTSFSAGLERLGDGSKGKGAMKLGLAGLPVLAAAYEPETFTYDQMKEAEAYDPNATLNLDDPALDSGIEDVIDSDSGLRLYAKEGGIIPTYAEGGTIESRADQGMRDALARNKETAYAPSTSTTGMTGALARNEGIAYTRPTTAPVTTTAPSNNIKIAGAGNSTTNLTGGVGALNVGSGTIGKSPNQALRDTHFKMLRGYEVPIDYTPGSPGGQGNIYSGYTQPTQASHTYNRATKKWEKTKPVRQPFRIGSNNGIGNQYSMQTAFSGYGGPDVGVAQYAKGGMLEGPGDGMSDSLAAQIDGSQPAALSQGEFVVPADVVSHLGNGSSDAGSKRLYAMMDEVRKARTGTEKQGKEINPERYMPA
jgi:hypothetical protein